MSLGKFLALYFCASISGRALAGATDEIFKVNASQSEIKIMSYNLLNLFDATHDEGKDDWTFLPRSTPGKQENCEAIPEDFYRKECLEIDWTNERLKGKIAQIKKAVMASGTLPDILGTLEIENKNVATMLAAALGFKKFLITDSPGSRGVDVALFFNETKITHIEHEYIRLQNVKTRDILRVLFKVNSTGELLNVYLNHWPAMSAPAQFRLAAANRLKDSVDEQMAKYGPRHGILSMGDFNTPEDENPNAFDDIINNQNWANALIDGENFARSSKLNMAVPYFPPGTYWFIGKNNWNKFDRFNLSRGLIKRTGLRFLPESFRIFFPSLLGCMVNYKDGESGASKKVKAPKTFNFTAKTNEDLGFADHLPIILKLAIK